MSYEALARRSVTSCIIAAALVSCGRQDAYFTCNSQLTCSSTAPLCLSDTTATHHTSLFCTQRCTTPAATSSACPGNAACVRLNGGDPVCMALCTSTAECDFSNALCTTLPESLGARVCATQP